MFQGPKNGGGGGATIMENTVIYFNVVIKYINVTNGYHSIKN